MGQITAFQQRYVLPWEVVTTNTTGVANNGYIANSGGTIEVSLPSVAAVGDAVAVTSINGLWKVTQGAGQYIRLVGTTTTVGAGGYLEGQATGDGAWLVCSVANTEFVLISSTGILTAV